ncbi:MAG: helix-turn-helix domain-containing protein [Candidatus Azobacteroides sp.]|nr:helix-turn-helix domain-containing protein [Candidatus Azobacteroides sp.]
MTKIFETLEKLEILHTLIKQRCTGSPGCLAKRLNISRSSLYDLLDELKSRDVPIAYSRSRRSFYYTGEFEMNVQLDLRLIYKDEAQEISGGFYNFFLPFFFPDGTALTLHHRNPEFLR